MGDFVAVFGSEKKDDFPRNHRRKPLDAEETKIKQYSTENKCFVLWTSIVYCGNASVEPLNANDDGSCCCSRQRNGWKVNIWRLKRRETWRDPVRSRLFFASPLWSFYLIFVGDCDTAISRSNRTTSKEITNIEETREREREKRENAIKLTAIGQNLYEHSDANESSPPTAIAATGRCIHFVRFIVAARAIAASNVAFVQLSAILSMIFRHI